MSIKKLIIIGILLISAPALADDLMFERKELKIISDDGKEHVFTVEVADTAKKHERGLMFRKSIPEDFGMLFLFDRKMEVNMWMVNTYIPLDIAFIAPDGRISKLVTEATPLSDEIISSDGEVSVVLELNAGTYQKLGIKKNDKVVF